MAVQVGVARTWIGDLLLAEVGVGIAGEVDEAEVVVGAAEVERVEGAEAAEGGVDGVRDRAVVEGAQHLLVVAQAEDAAHATFGE